MSETWYNDYDSSDDTIVIPTTDGPVKNLINTSWEFYVLNGLESYGKSSITSAILDFIHHRPDAFKDLDTIMNDIKLLTFEEIKDIFVTCYSYLTTENTIEAAILQCRILKTAVLRRPFI